MRLTALARKGQGFAVLLLAAMLQACSLAWPFEFGFAGLLTRGQPSAVLQILCLLVLAWQLRKISRGGSFVQAAARAWFYATVWLCAVFWWLFVSMHEVGGMPAPLAALAVLLLAAALGIYYALMCGLLARCEASTPVRAAGFASAWTLAELMRGQWFTGFPWGAIGYAHPDGWLGAWAPVLGIYGVGWLATFIAALLAAGIQRPQSVRREPARLVRVWVVVIAVVALPFVLQKTQPDHWQWGQANGRFKAQLLQGNIDQTEKFDAAKGVRDALAWYSAQPRSASADLVLAPETAIPLFEQELPPGYLANMMGGAETARALMIGIPTRSEAGSYANSVVALDRGSPHQAKARYQYHKHHLVPFGEFVPPLFRWFTDLMRIPLSDFSRGAIQQPSYPFMGQRLGPNICYEDLFGEEWALRFADSQNAPTVMVNFSNIAWFGKTIAVDQHLQISRMRALEFQRPVLRATNSGATALIDERGRVVALLPAHQRGKLDVELQGRDGAVTPYARWAGRLGLWPLWIGCALLLGLMLVTNRTYSARMEA